MENNFSIQIPLCDIAVCSGKNCVIPDFLRHDKSLLNNNRKGKRENPNSISFDLQWPKTEQYELKDIEIPLCDIAVCSGKNCDIPDFLRHDKSLLKNNEKGKYENLNNVSFDLQKPGTEQYELKELKIQLCDVAVCSDGNCDIPDNLHKRRYAFRNRFVNYKQYEVKSESENSSTVESENEYSPTSEKDNDEDYYPVSESDTDEDYEEVESESLPSPTSESDTDEDYYPVETGLSEYEKMVQQNRAEKLAFLQSLNINEVKEQCMKCNKKLKPVRKPKVKIQHDSASESAPLRRSQRENRVKIDLNEEALEQRSTTEATQKLEADVKKQCSTGLSKKSSKGRSSQASKSKIKSFKLKTVPCIKKSQHTLKQQMPETDLSEYEKMVQHNRAEKLAFLESLNINEES